ncbi:MAG: metallophosphatase family protein [Muribaculaceae bacterium]|nr:metallophosphatase family protein [Muribaculaceae bacterium]
MKRIGLLSDTHSCYDPRYALHFADCDEVWHAGDVGDAALLRRVQELAPVVRAVRGNIDHGEVARLLPSLLHFRVEDVDVLLTHIAGYPGRYAPGFRAVLESKRPRLLVAGHSHILKVMPDPAFDLLYINPGAAGVHGWQKVRTLVRFTIDGPDIRDLEVIELGKQYTP